MNDRTIPAGDNAPAKQPAKQRPQVGDYLISCRPWARIAATR